MSRRSVVRGILCCFLWPSVVQGQTIQGEITESLTDRHVRSADVVLHSPSGEVLDRTRSTAGGTFVFTDLPDDGGPYLVRAEALGYRSTTRRIELAGRDTVTVAIALEVEPVPLDSVAAEAERRRGTLVENGFVDRLDVGRGEFVTPAWIAERDPMDLGHVFQMLPRTRVRFRPVDPSGPRRVPVLRRGRLECDRPDIFIDGLQMPRGIGLDQLGVPVQDLKAMEVYRDPAAAPPEYGGGGMEEVSGACGIVLIWTWNQD